VYTHVGLAVEITCSWRSETTL